MLMAFLHTQLKKIGAVEVTMDEITLNHINVQRKIKGKSKMGKH